jgi:hypothetical protein
MKLINTDGMAFIGPGSEWFWTALSGIVLAVTFLAIYRQLRLQSSANAFKQIDSFQRELMSERTTRYILDILIALRDGAEPEDIPDSPAAALANYWDKLGLLTRGGHVDRTLIYNFIGAGCQVWWATLAPYALAVRARWGDPTLWVHFEWLAGVMLEMDRRAGVATTYDAELLASLLEGRIDGCHDAIRIEQSLRTVIIASPEAVPAAPAATAAAAEG